MWLRRRRESTAVAIGINRRCRRGWVRVSVVLVAVVVKMAQAGTVGVGAWNGEGRRHGGRRRATESRIVGRRGLMGWMAEVVWLRRVRLAWEREESIR